MAEYIEREALEVELNHRLNFLMGEDGEYDHYTSGFDEAVTRVENFPAADVAPVQHGKWLYGDYYDIGDVCSECDWDSKMTHPSYRYCPNCGAKMDEEVSE